MSLVGNWLVEATYKSRRSLIGYFSPDLHLVDTLVDTPATV